MPRGMYWMGLFVVLTGCEQITGQKNDDDTGYYISSISSGAVPTVSGTYSWGGSPSPTLRAENLSVADGSNIDFNLVPSASVAMNFSVPFKTGSYPISSNATDVPTGTARVLPSISPLTGVTGTVVVTEASVARTDRSRGVVRLGVTVNATVRSLGFTGQTTTPVVGTFNISFDNRSDPPYQPPTGGGGALNLICPNVSSPYRCLTNATGQQIPTLYNRPELHGTWFDEGIGLCITWNADGTSRGRNRGGIGGGPRDFPGQWGVIVNAKGEFQPTANQWYVFTTGLDAQTTLLTFDKTAVSPRQIVGWAFRKASDGKCPW